MLFADFEGYGDAEADVVAAGVAWEEVAMGAAEETREMIPCATAKDAQIAGAAPCGALGGSAVVGGVPNVGDPLADVAVDVVEAEDIGRIGAGRGAAAGTDAGAVLGVEVIGDERSDFIAEGEGASGTGTACEFPLGLAGEPVGAAGLEGEPCAVLGGVDPANEDGGKNGVFLRQKVRAEETELGDGNGTGGYGEAGRNGYLVGGTLGVAGGGIAGGVAHCEPTGRDIHHDGPIRVLPEAAGSPSGESAAEEIMRRRDHWERG